MIFIFCNDYSALSNSRTDVIGVHSLSERCLLHLVCYYVVSCIFQLCHIHSSLNTVCSKQYGVSRKTRNGETEKRRIGEILFTHSPILPFSPSPLLRFYSFTAYCLLFLVFHMPPSQAPLPLL